MTSIAEAFMRLRVDSSQVKRDTERGLSSVNGASAGRRLGSTFMAGFRAVAIGVTAVGGLIVAGLAAAVNAARQLNLAPLQVAAKNAGIEWAKFKPQVDAAGSSMAKLGFTQADVNKTLTKAITVTGNGGVALRSLGTIADFARYKHVSLSDAMQILTTAAAGNTRALRQVGISTSELPKNFATTGTAASRLETVMGLLNTRIGGQAAAYATTFGGKLEVLRAQFTNLAAKVGSALLPILSSLLGMISGSIVPALERFGAWFTTVGVPSLTHFAQTVMPGVRLAFGLLATGVSTIVKALGAMPGPVKIAVAALAALGIALTLISAHPLVALTLAIVAAVGAVVKYWPQISSALTAGWNTVWDTVIGPMINFFTKTIPHVIGVALDWIKANWPMLVAILTGPVGIAVGAIVKFWPQITSGLKAAWDAVVGFFRPAIDSFTNWWRSNVGALSDIWNAVWGTLSSIVKTIWPPIQAVIQGGLSIIGSIFSTTMGVVRAVWDAGWRVLSVVVSTVWGVIHAAISAGWAVVQTIFSTAWGVVRAVWDAGWAVLSGAVKLVWGAIQTIIKVGWDIIVGIFTTFINLVTGRWGAAWNALRTMFEQVWNAIRSFLGTILGVIESVITAAWNLIRSVTTTVWNAISAFFTTIWNLIRSIFQTVVNAIGALLSTAWNLIRSVITTVWNGIVSFFTTIWNTIKNVFTTTVNAIASVLSGAWNAISNTAKSVWNSLASWFSGFWNGLKAAWKLAVDGIHAMLDGVWNGIKATASTIWGGIKTAIDTIWSGIKAVVGTPVNVVISIINAVGKGINAVVRWVTGKNAFGEPVLNPVRWKTGGRIPGYGGGDIIPAWIKGGGPALLEPGETVVSKEASRLPFMQEAFRAAGVPGYQLGGIIGAIPGIGPAVQALGSLAKLIPGPVSDAVKKLEALTSGGVTGPGVWATIMKQAVDKLLKLPLQKLKDLIVQKIGPAISNAIRYTGPLARIPGAGQTITADVAEAQRFAGDLVAKLWPGTATQQMTALLALWYGESGWNRLAKNASSGAYGIPQALPASKMSAFGTDYLYNAATQIRWGLDYIKSRYGSPIQAYNFWLSQSPHWYRKGGAVRAFANGGLIPEPVIGLGASGARYRFEAGESVQSQQAAMATAKRLDAVLVRLDRLIATTAAVPAGVGRHVGGAIGGAASDAAFRARYPHSGW